MTAQQRTLLIVDDEAPLRRVLQRALTRQGYHVLTAASAEAAYSLLDSERADALLIDIHLPTMSGLALYTAIEHRWPKLMGRMAIMTGDADADEVRSWLETNRCTVLRKPFDLHEITVWLERVWQIRERETGSG